MYKWILALIGFYIFRLPGFFIGMFIGHQIDKNNFTKIGNSIKKEFELNLLALASILIKSDGEVSKQELQFVRNYFISIYGQYRANILFKEFNTNIDKKNISAKQICNFFLKRTTYGTRLQLIHFLFNIAKADGSISKAEIEKLLEFTQLLNISIADFESIKAMFFKSSDSDYKILEVDKNCSNEDLKKAYRELAKKHHPDKVQNLGDVYVKAAKEKFSKIQAAYENIKKQRGI